MLASNPPESEIPSLYDPQMKSHAGLQDHQGGVSSLLMSNLNRFGNSGFMLGVRHKDSGKESDLGHEVGTPPPNSCLEVNLVHMGAE